MPKVIYKIKSKLELRRGLEGKSSDPYTYRSNLKMRNLRKLNWTLVSRISQPRCSSTYNSSNKNATYNNYIKHNRNMRVLGVSSGAILLMLLTLTILPVAESHETAEATSGESETTINLVKANADLSLTAVSSDGTFASSSSSEQAQFSVTTTNYTGYTLTIAASDDDQTLVNTDTSITTHNTFTSIPNGTVIDEKTFDDASYNGKWGYKPSKINSTTNVGFWPSPTESNPTTLDVTESANSNANNYTIALGARADYTQATGTYSKTMTLTATANPTPYSITYTDNTNDATVKNLPDVSGSTTNATQITLSSVTPSRTGYVFAGWCDEAPTSSGTVCGGNSYTVSGSYPINQTTTNVITLYATWEVPEYDITIKPGAGISSVSLNGQSCNNATTGCVVTDLTYGQNYALTATASTGSTFSAWYVNGAGNAVSPTSASTNFTVGEGEATITANSTTSLTPPTTVMQNFTNAMCETYAKNGIQLTDSRDNRLYNVRWINNKCWMTDNLALGANPANPNTTSISIDQNNTNINTSKTLTVYDLVSNGASGQNCQSPNGYNYLCMHTNDEGDSVWYNYAAASAGTITGASNTTEAQYSLCPAGWRMPTKDEIAAVTGYVAYFNPVRGGVFENGVHSGANAHSYTWSSTAPGQNTATYRYNLVYSGSSLYLSGDYGWRFSGHYIRCIRSS